MIGNVDSRVVEMHFDNSDFMGKIEETIDALDRLNEKISSINQVQGLMNLSSGASVGLGEVENSLGNIEQRFSVLGIVGMTIVQRLTNAAIDGVMKVKNLLTAAARQTKQGGFIRAQNIEQAKFLLEGLGADVTKVMENVNTAVDGTSYGLDEAARAAASFYASGIKAGPPMEKSLRAVAGVAAMTGSDYASIADIFTTVAGQGKVMTMQLRMMEGRGLNAAATMRDFFNEVITHGDKFNDSIRKNVQELTGGTKVSEEQVRDFVTKGKIDFEAFSAAMDYAFGEHAQEANKTFSGSLANMKTALSRLGEAFITPGMQAAIPVFNAIRESISGFTNALKSSKAYIEIDRIMKSIERLGKVSGHDLYNLSNFGINGAKVLTDYINGVNNGSIKANDSIKKVVKELTGGSKVSEAAVRDFVNDGKISFELFSAAMEEPLKKFKAFSNVSSLVTAFEKSIKSLGNSIATTIKKFNESDTISNVAIAIYNSFRILKTIFGVVKEAFKEVFPKSAIDSLEKLSAKLAENTALAADWLLAWKNTKGLKNVLVGFFSGIKGIFNIVSGLFKILKSGLSVIGDLLGRSTKLTEVFRNLMEGFDKKTGTIGIFDKLSKLLEGMGKLASKAFDMIADGIGKVVKKAAEGIGSIDNMNEAFAAVGLLFTALFSQKQIRMIMSWKNRLSKEMREMLRFLDFGSYIGEDGKKHNLLTTQINDVLSSTTRYLKQMTLQVNASIISKIAISILALAVALELLQSIDSNKLAGGMAAITVMLAEMTAVMYILIQTLDASITSETIKGIYSLGALTNALIKLGIAMILMAEALKIIAQLDPKQLATGLAGFIIILGAVLGFILVLDKYQKVAADKSVGTMMLLIAMSLRTIADAVKTLASLNVPELAKGLGSVVVLLVAMAKFITAITSIEGAGGAGMISAGLGMIAMATALNILAPALQKIGSLSLEELAKGLGAIVIALMAMGQATLITDTSGAVGLLLISVALASFATALERIGKLDIKTLAKGLGTIILTLIAFGAISAIFSSIIPAMIALGAAMLLLSASIAVLGAGLVLIGTGLTTISAGIMSFASISTLAVQTFVETMKVVLISLLTMLPTIASAIAKSLVEFLKTLSDLAPKMTEYISKIIDALLNALMENVPKITKVGLELIDGLLSGIAEKIPSITDSAVKIVAGFIQGIADNLPLIIDAGISLMLSFINGLANGIREHTEDVRAAIWNLCTALLEAFMTFFGIASPSTVMEGQGRYIGEGLINGLKNIGGAVVAAFRNLIARGLSAVRKRARDFKNAAKTLVSNLISGIKNKISSVVSAFTSLITKAVAAVKRGASKFVTAGSNLAKGVAKGIRNGLSHVLSAAGDIARQALKKFKSKLGISSPSKVFAEAARWIPEGIVVGINKTSKKVTSAVDNLATGTVDAMSEAVSKAYDMLESTDDFSPTITPVLDLSEVKKNASGINSILGDTSISAAYSAQNANDITQNATTNKLMEALVNKIGEIANNDNTNKIPPMVNHINVDGAENPEDFANRLIQRFAMEMRTG